MSEFLNMDMLDYFKKIYDLTNQEFALFSIPDISMQNAKDLLEHFCTISALCTATKEEMMNRVEGITSDKADIIFLFLHSIEKNPEEQCDES